MSGGCELRLRGNGCGNRTDVWVWVASRELGEWQEVVAGLSRAALCPCPCPVRAVPRAGAKGSFMPSNSACSSSDLKKVSFDFRKLQATTALCLRFPSSCKARVIFIN